MKKENDMCKEMYFTMAIMVTGTVMVFVAAAVAFAYVGGMR